MSYMQKKLVKTSVAIHKLNGKLHLPFHTKNKILMIEKVHHDKFSSFRKLNKEYLKSARQFLQSHFNGYRTYDGTCAILVKMI